MILRNSFLAKGDVTLGANKSRILFLFVNLEIQYSALVRRGRNVTTVGASTRPNGNPHGCRIDRIEGCYFVTTQTIQIGVLATFVTKRAGRNSFAPSRKNEPIRDPHISNQPGIEINFQGWPWCQ